MTPNLKVQTTRWHELQIRVSAGEFNVFMEHTPGNFHGHRRKWSGLSQDMKNVLIKNKITNVKGDIL